MRPQDESLDPLLGWLKSAPRRLRGPAHDGALALRAVPESQLLRARSFDRLARLALRHWPRAINAKTTVPAFRDYAERSISAAIAAFQNGGGW